MKLAKKKPITSGSRHQININKNVLGKQSSSVKNLVFNIHKNVGRSSLTAHVTICAKPFAAVLIRGFSSYNPRILLPESVRKGINSPLFQLGSLVLVLVSFYVFCLGFKLFLDIIAIELMFLFSVIAHFNFAEQKKKEIKMTRYSLFFSLFYSLFCLCIAVYTGFWLRVLISTIMLFFLVRKLLPATTQTRQKILPGFLTDYLEANKRDEVVLANHLTFDLPFVLSVKKIFPYYSLFLYGAFTFSFINPDLLGLTKESLAFLISSNLLSLIYVFVFTLYVIWCCNPVTENAVFGTFKYGLGLGFGFIATQFVLNASPGVPSLLPASVKYEHQHLLHGPITVDETDRAVHHIQNLLREAGIFYLHCDTKDSFYPNRYDAKAHFDAWQALKNGASNEEVVKILTRNSELTKSNLRKRPTTTFLGGILSPVPEREHLTESVEDSNNRARLNAPLGVKGPNFPFSVCNPPIQPGLSFLSKLIIDKWIKEGK